MHRRSIFPAPLAAGLAVIALTLGLSAQEHAHQPAAAPCRCSRSRCRSGGSRRRSPIWVSRCPQPIVTRSMPRSRSRTNRLPWRVSRRCSIAASWRRCTSIRRAESKSSTGMPRPELVQGGTRIFLVKVLNDAGVTAPLAGPEPEHRPRVRAVAQRVGDPEPRKVLTDAQVRERWAEMSIYTEPPMRPRLSGLPVEYAILQIYSRDAGPAIRDARLQRRPGNAGHRFPQRHRRPVQRRCPSHPVRVQRARRARQADHRRVPDRGRSRTDLSECLEAAGAGLLLPAAGLPRRRRHDRPAGRDVHADGVARAGIRRRRRGAVDVWPARRRWLFTAGRAGSIRRATAGTPAIITSTRPAARTTRIRPKACCRRTCGRRSTARRSNVASRADVGAVGTTSRSSSSPATIIRCRTPSTTDALRPRGLRVSVEPCRPSRPARAEGPGLSRHEAARGLADLDAAGAALGEGAGRGRRLRAFGLGPRGAQQRSCRTTRCPASTASAPTSSSSTSPSPTPSTSSRPGDTPYVWELNIWYHTLNVGFRTRISGETDFPCITDDRVGLARSYAKVDGPLTYRKWIDAVQRGPQLRLGRQEPPDGLHRQRRAGGTGESEVRLDRAGTRQGDGAGRGQSRHAARTNRSARRGTTRSRTGIIERARIGNGREVPVEIVVNGAVVATQKLVADGKIRDADVRRRDRSQQLDRGAHPAVVAHEPGVRARRRQADPRVAPERAVVPERREPVLDAEGVADQGRRARGRARGLRSRARGVSAAPGRNAITSAHEGESVRAALALRSSISSMLRSYAGDAGLGVPAAGTDGGRRPDTPRSAGARACDGRAASRARGAAR